MKVGLKVRASGVLTPIYAHDATVEVVMTWSRYASALEAIGVTPASLRKSSVPKYLPILDICPHPKSAWTYICALAG